MALRDGTVARLDGYWAEWLGCDPAALSGDGVTVVPSARPGTDRVRLLFRPATTVVVVPERLESHLRERASRLRGLDGRDADRVAAALDIARDGGAVTLGPQFAGYADDATLADVDTTGVRPLEPGDAGKLAVLRSACPPEEWAGRVGGFAAGAHEILHGRVVDGRLVAVAAAGADDAVAGIGVIVHPEYRQRGHGSAAVASVARAATERGLIPEYRAHDSWTASVALAGRVGFERYATYLVLDTGPNPTTTG